MWRVFHALFGFDYFIYQFGHGRKIARIMLAPNGTPYFILCCSGNYPMTELKSREPLALTMSQEELERMINNDPS